MIRALFTAFFSLIFTFSSLAQNPQRFDHEIARFKQIPKSNAQDVTIFTGSSSIRMWTSLREDCAGSQLVNTGFGGSLMTDLLYFLDEAVLNFAPGRVYIYEGDNDIAAGKSPQDIMKTTREVVSRLLAANPEMEVYFISAKPSPSRWAFKDGYLELNRLLDTYCNENERLHYIDVWEPMIDEAGRPSAELFVADSLHMNRKGYILWKEIICPNE